LFRDISKTTSQVREVAAQAVPRVRDDGRAKPLDAGDRSAGQSLTRSRMTIAACYLSHEGVVLGADSTATYRFGNRPHYYDFNQKLFEVGRKTTLGITTWGRGELDGTSFRTLIAELADSLVATPPASMTEIADRWVTLFGGRWGAAFATQIARGQALEAKLQAQGLTQPEAQELVNLINSYFTGFCLGGYWPPDRTPQAFVFEFDPRVAQVAPQPLAYDTASFFAMRTPILRMIKGYDDRLVGDIMKSGKWTGTEQELRAIMGKYQLTHDVRLPLRDAIDFVHAGIYTTIKAVKFSRVDQSCGGPIEIAVISSDRRFRWVRHKQMDQAVMLQEGRHAKRSKA